MRGKRAEARSRKEVARARRELLSVPITLSVFDPIPPAYADSLMAMVPKSPPCRTLRVTATKPLFADSPAFAALEELASRIELRIHAGPIVAIEVVGSSPYGSSRDAFVRVRLRVPNRHPPHETMDLTIDSPLFPIAGATGLGLAKLVRETCVFALTHETDEGIHVDGLRVFDPHASPWSNEQASSASRRVADEMRDSVPPPASFADDEAKRLKEGFDVLAYLKCLERGNFAAEPPHAADCRCGECASARQYGSDAFARFPPQQGDLKAPGPDAFAEVAALYARQYERLVGFPPPYLARGNPADEYTWLRTTLGRLAR